jgi:hypothetical protein
MYVGMMPLQLHVHDPLDEIDPCHLLSSTILYQGQTSIKSSVAPASTMALARLSTPSLALDALVPPCIGAYQAIIHCPIIIPQRPKSL